MAGLVLLDPAHEDYNAAMPAELKQSRAATVVLEVLTSVVDVALMTAPTTALLEGAAADTPLPATGLRESRKVERRYAEVRRAGPCRTSR